MYFFTTQGLLKQVLRQLKIKVDYDLNVMTSNQKIEGLYGLIFNKLSKIIDEKNQIFQSSKEIQLQPCLSNDFKIKKVK